MMKSIRPAATFALCLLGIGLIGYPILKQLTEYSFSDESASHIVLIPFVTAALIYRQRERIFSVVYADYRFGLPLVCAGAILLFAVRFGPLASTRVSLTLSASALVLLSIGAFVTIFGRPAARAALFPLLFLAAAIPIPEQLLNVAIDVLKRGSTEAVALLFRATSTPFHREGFVFNLPNLAIEVADECSGIRSSIALTLTSLLGGYTFLRSPITRSALLLAVLPVTIVKNAIRIVALSLLTIHVDPTFITGRLHHDGGVAFFLMALALMAPWLVLLRRLEKTRSSSAEPATKVVVA
jgi:exosortase